MGSRVDFLGGVGGGGAKGKSPDFRCPEVGISADISTNVSAIFRLDCRIPGLTFRTFRSTPTPPPPTLNVRMEFRTNHVSQAAMLRSQFEGKY